jgi:hypothetical protein
MSSIAITMCATYPLPQGRGFVDVVRAAGGGFV